MNTEQQIKQIAEELRSLIQTDNDAQRLVNEYIGELFSDPNEVKSLNNTIEELEEEIETLKDDKQDLENKIEKLEEEIEELTADA